MISTRGRYAIRVLIDIAVNGNNNFISLNEISKRQEISIKYLENIIKILVKNNIIMTKKGKTGGYKLIKNPNNIIIFEILKLTEKNLNCTKCQKNNETCHRKKTCLTISMWEKFDKIKKDFFSNITIQDLINKNI